jgi:hypothetical protein
MIDSLPARNRTVIQGRRPRPVPIMASSTGRGALNDVAALAAPVSFQRDGDTPCLIARAGSRLLPCRGPFPMLCDPPPVTQSGNPHKRRLEMPGEPQ